MFNHKVVSSRFGEAMSRLAYLLFCLPFALLVSTAPAQGTNSTPLRVASPNGQIVLILSSAAAAPPPAAPTATNDSLRYAVEFHGKALIDESALGLKIEGQPALGPGMHIVSAKTDTVEQSYTIPVGKTSTVRDHYNSARAQCEDTAGHQLWLDIRAYDDGIAFRYFLPEQPAFEKVRIEHELTQFRYSKDAALYPLLVDGFQS